ncbi:MAG TPA: Mpo1-like protein [Alphaproteobacteria bacterium]|jgi:uncharacterized membrane protein YGL010W|nr:Mpo1-like protein [Alphaproteobacteria bacterium]
MRTQRQFLDEYRKTHSNPTNAWVHTICVPIILFASIGMLWTLPLGLWVGLAAPLAPWVNGATVVALLTLIFYATLSARAVLYMTAIFAVCAVIVIAMGNAGLPVLWICAALWVAAWLGQFYGHHVEGAKPAFLDDVVFLLIGPLFILEKFNLLPSHTVAHAS